MTFGIDVSTWQKGFSFTKAKNEGVQFAIIRGGFTGYGKGKVQAKDDQFESHYKNAKINGLGVGCYFFSRAVSKAEGEKEAAFLYENCLKGKQFEYPIYIDVEDKYYQAKASKQAVTDAIIGFCEYLENKGYYVGVYANTDWFKNRMYLDQLKAYDKWIAQWSKNRPTTPDGGLWQFGGETNYIRANKVAGVTCDQNYSYKDYPSIMKNASLNGYTAIKGEDNTNTPVEPKKSLETIANEVLQGKWGNGQDRVNNLTKAGYNYDEVQRIVNGMTRSITYTVQKGDYLIKIGKKFNVSWFKIAKDNNIKFPYTIRVGQVLKINK